MIRDIRRISSLSKGQSENCTSDRAWWDHIEHILVWKKIDKKDENEGWQCSEHVIDYQQHRFSGGGNKKESEHDTAHRAKQERQDRYLQSDPGPIGKRLGVWSE